MLLEAMIARRGIIAAERGAIPEMQGIRSKAPCGIVVEPGNVSHLREEMETMIANPELAQAMGISGQRRALALYPAPVIVDALCKRRVPAAAQTPK